jgi:KaiC/GvpD/RAD55 family RecA-like ATPase
MGELVRVNYSEGHREDATFIPEGFKRIPTGISHFDSIIKGGLPSGTTILLLGEMGAGAEEFAYTAAAKTLLVKNQPELSDFFLGRRISADELPDKVCYVTFSRSREDVLREIAISFNRDFYEAFRDNVVFKDFSDVYFRHTVVPSNWAGAGASIFGKKEDDSLLASLVRFMDENAPDSLVIIDSVTDLVVSADIDMDQLISVLKGMQRMSKKWGGLVLLKLTRDILDERVQRKIMDCMDGSFVFEWSRFIQTSRRQRYLYVEKFISILPHLDKERIARFATIVTAQDGFVVIDTERIG